MDLGVLSAKVDLALGGFDRGIAEVKRGFGSLGAQAVKLNQALDLVSRAYRGITTVGKEVAGSFLEAASTAERYQITLKTLLGSEREGARLFKEMSTYAATVPFEYEKIMGSATALAGVMNGGVEEIKQWMPMIADLAAVSRLSIEETTGQIVRMYSAGAAAADLFRDRGITAMLGFTAGVQYTAKETREQLMKAYNDPLSKFRGTADDLGKSWEGILSMMGDQWFLFRNKVMNNGAFDEIKRIVNGILDNIRRLEATGKLDEWAKKIGTEVANFARAAEEFVRTNLPSALEDAKDAFQRIWSIINYDPAIIEYGLIGTAVFGRKGGILLGSMAHMVKVLGNIAKAIDAVNAGQLDFKDFAGANFKELEALLNGIETENMEALTFQAGQLKEEIAEIQERLRRPFIFAADKTALKDLTEKLAKVELKIAYKLAEEDKRGITAQFQDVFDGLKYEPEVNPVVRQQPLTKEAKGALEKLKEQIGDLQFEVNTAGLEGLDLELAKVGQNTAKLRKEYSELASEAPEILRLVDAVDLWGRKAAEAAEKFRVDKEAKSAAEDLVDELNTLSAEGMAITMNDFDQAVLEASLSTEALKNQYAELIETHPELREMIDSIYEMKVANAEAAQNFQATEMMRRQREDLEDLYLLMGSIADTSLFGGMNAELADINRQFEELIRLGGKFAELAPKWKANQEEMVRLKVISGEVQEVTGAMAGALGDSLAELAKSGKMNLKGLASSLVETLQVYAAQKTAHLLMEAAYRGIMAMVDSTRREQWLAEAAVALKGAAVMGSFVAGSALAGMAHDGITNVPKEGTWLLQENERVVDADTNRDLKEFLAGGGGGTTIIMENHFGAGSNEESVKRALPDLRDAVLEIVNSDITSGGPTIKNIKTYA